MIKSKKKCGLVYVAMAIAVCVIILAGCGGGATEDDYPDALCVTSYDIIASNKRMAVNESQFAMSIVDSMYAKTLPKGDDNKVARQHHLAIIDAASFPTDEAAATIKAGGIYRADVERIIPSTREIVIMETSGSLIKELAENTIYGFINAGEKDPSPNNIYHFSGLAFVFDKDASRGNMIIDTALADDGKIKIAERYTVALNRQLAERLIQTYEKVDTQIKSTVGNEVDIVCGYLGENKLSSFNSRFVSKSERDTPTVVVTVLIVIGVLAIAGVIIAYFVMKNKQQKARKARNNQPRIDI